MFAGSMMSITETAPLAIYDRFPTDFVGAQALSAVLVAAAGGVLLTTRLLTRAREKQLASG
jgi:molybdate transport system permease protein